MWVNLLNANFRGSMSFKSNSKHLRAQYLPEMWEYFTSRQREVFQNHLFSGITETEICVSTGSVDMYFSFETGWNFMNAFVGYKTLSFVSAECQMNFTGKLDLGSHALKETDQFSSELQAIPSAFSLSV